MPALEGQFLKEISVRFAGENHLSWAAANGGVTNAGLRGV